MNNLKHDNSYTRNEVYMHGNGVRLFSLIEMKRFRPNERESILDRCTFGTIGGKFSEVYFVSEK